MDAGIEIDGMNQVRGIEISASIKQNDSLECLDKLVPATIPRESKRTLTMLQYTSLP